MVNLDDNIYNRHLGRDEPKLKIWRYAGLILTYKCPAQCAFCYYNCGPDASGLMGIDTALSTWQSLKDLAGASARVHITGGEPFVYWDHLAELMSCAHQEGLTPLDSLETNAYWATDRKVVTERLRFLDSVGLVRLKISCDSFHAEFIDVDRVRMLLEAALEVLGPGRVLVRWEKYLQKPVKFPRENTDEIERFYVSAVGDSPCRFTGRAAMKLGPLVADKTVEEIALLNCRRSFLSARGVHVDPCGNVFSGLCSGISVGNVTKSPLKEIWKGFRPQDEVPIEKLFGGGPAELATEAKEFGYRPGKKYAGKCHLCTDVRQFFFDLGMYKTIIGPGDCYSQKRCV